MMCVICYAGGLAMTDNSPVSGMSLIKVIDELPEEEATGEEWQQVGPTIQCSP